MAKFSVHLHSNFDNVTIILDRLECRLEMRQSDPETVINNSDINIVKEFQPDFCGHLDQDCFQETSSCRRMLKDSVVDCCLRIHVHNRRSIVASAESGCLLKKELRLLTSLLNHSRH
jgi:hypothetical protein